MKLSTTVFAAALALGTLGSSLHAQEATIRSNLGKRIQLFKNIDEVRKTSIPGIYEIRVNGSEIYYSDAKGEHIFQGNLILTSDKELRNLTEERINKLTAVKFESLPFKDAFTIVRGNGQRKLAVFEDPNCGYCKRFRKETLTKLQDTTVYTYVYPVLGRDSVDKAQKVMCAADKSKMWDDWMLRDQSPSGEGNCNPPINDLVALGRGMGVSGTPTVFFQDGTRASGAIPASDLNRRIAAASRPK